MNTNDILAALDAEIARLEQVRSALAGPSAPKRRGRPPGAVTKPTRKRRTLSAAARKKIADAQRKRWAATKVAAKASAPKKVAKKTIRKARKKTLPKKAAITKIPPKRQRGHKPRVAKSAKSALSGKSEIVAGPQSNNEA